MDKWEMEGGVASSELYPRFNNTVQPSRSTMPLRSKSLWGGDLVALLDDRQSRQCCFPFPCPPSKGDKLSSQMRLWTTRIEAGTRFKLMGKTEGVGEGLLLSLAESMRQRERLAFDQGFHV